MWLMVGSITVTSLWFLLFSMCPLIAIYTFFKLQFLTLICTQKSLTLVMPIHKMLRLTTMQQDRPTCVWTRVNRMQCIKFHEAMVAAVPGISAWGSTYNVRVAECWVIKVRLHPVKSIKLICARVTGYVQWQSAVHGEALTTNKEVQLAIT